MRITEVMTADPACCPRDMKLPEVARFMRNNDCGEIPVIDSDTSRKLVGVITDRDIVCRAVAGDMNIPETRVSEVMTPSPVTVANNASLDECREKMEEHRIRRVPVIDPEGRVCGIVAQADIARLGSMQEIAELVQDVSQRDEPRARQ